MKLLRLLMAASACIAMPSMAQDEQVDPLAVLDPATDLDAPAEEAADEVADDVDPDVRALAEECPAFKFEREIKVNPNAPRGQKVKICSVAGASEDDWIKTLQDAVTQVEGQDMPPRFKEQLLAELRAEIARFSMRLPSEREQARVASVAQTVPESTLAGNSAEVSEPEVPVDLPQAVEPPAVPDPTPPVEPAATIPPPAASPTLPVAPPREPPKTMRAVVTCLERGDRGAGITCDFLRKDTYVMLRASAGLEEGGSLRFVRRGDERATVDIPALRNGQLMRIAIPSRVCAGVASSELTLQLLRPSNGRSGGGIAQSFGPFGLRCR